VAARRNLESGCSPQVAKPMLARIAEETITACRAARSGDTLAVSA